MKVDTIAVADVDQPQTYYVLPGVEGVSSRDLQFREFAAQVERALRYGGYSRTHRARDAALIILLSYGIGEPRVDHEIVSRPILDEVPTGNSTTVGYGSTTSFGGHSMTTITSSTTQERRLGVVGTSTYSRKTIEFDRFLTLAAVKAKHYELTGEIEEVWRTTVTSTGSSDDLRRAFPVMLAGAMRRIAIDTRGKQLLDVPEDHPRVLYIKGEISGAALRASGE